MPDKHDKLAFFQTQTYLQSIQLHHQPESAVKIEVNPFQAEGKGEKKKKVYRNEKLSPHLILKLE